MLARWRRAQNLRAPSVRAEKNEDGTRGFTSGYLLWASPMRHLQTSGVKPLHSKSSRPRAAK
jgi:hypothetical protein